MKAGYIAVKQIFGMEASSHVQYKMAIASF